MVSETLHFEGARQAEQVYGRDPSNLALLQESTGVQAVHRDGWIRLEGPPEQLAKVRDLFNLLENFLKTGCPIRASDFRYALGILNEQGIEPLRSLFREPIQTSARKPPVAPKTLGQRHYIDTIQRHDVTLGVGPAGTGKTYLAMAMAVAALREGSISRIILTRPAVEAGEALGFLPGDLHEKLTPYLRPLQDALHDMMPTEEIQKQSERGVIEIAPLAYMRGRTLNHAFIILDEAQNATGEQMFMFLTRLGMQSKAVITGDPTQVDLPHQKVSGLGEALRILEKVPGIGVVRFSKQDVVRHALVQRIIQAYESHRQSR